MSAYPVSALAALQVPAYRRFALGVFIASLGTQVQSTVLGIQVYALSREVHGIAHAAWNVGLVGLAEAVPFLALTLIGGWASDRYDRRWLCGGGLFLLSVGAVALFVWHLGSSMPIWPFLAVQALAGVARALFRPASVALSTQLVGSELYANAAAWRSTLFHLATVAGPALGAVTYTNYGPLITYAAVAVAYLAGVGAVCTLPRLERLPPLALPIWHSVREGLAFVWRQPLVLSAMALDLFAVLFGGAIAMLPAFALDLLHSGPESVGWLRAAPAVGAVAMGLYLARHGIRRRTGPLLLGCVAGFGATWIVFAASRSFWLSFALLALGGALDNVSVVIRATLVQTYTPRELIGRVSAVNSFFIGSSNELGAFESGLVARFLGLVPSVLLGGCMTLATVALVAWRAPSLRRLQTIDRP